MQPQSKTCPECGQASMQLGDTGLCAQCRSAQYGGAESHESAKLFEPAPTQIKGQLGLGDDA